MPTLTTTTLWSCILKNKLVSSPLVVCLLQPNCGPGKPSSIARTMSAPNQSSQSLTFSSACGPDMLRTDHSLGKLSLGYFSCKMAPRLIDVHQEPEQCGREQGVRCRMSERGRESEQRGGWMLEGGRESEQRGEGRVGLTVGQRVGLVKPTPCPSTQNQCSQSLTFSSACHLDMLRTLITVDPQHQASINSPSLET